LFSSRSIALKQLVAGIYVVLEIDGFFLPIVCFRARRFLSFEHDVSGVLEAVGSSIRHRQHVGQMKPPHSHRPAGLSTRPGVVRKALLQLEQTISFDSSTISKSSNGAIRRSDSPTTTTRY
jgi:hypothetical protein